jgi:hypothetical protein
MSGKHDAWCSDQPAAGKRGTRSSRGACVCGCHVLVWGRKDARGRQRKGGKGDASSILVTFGIARRLGAPQPRVLGMRVWPVKRGGGRVRRRRATWPGRGA